MLVPRFTLAWLLLLVTGASLLAFVAYWAWNFNHAWAWATLLGAGSLAAAFVVMSVVSLGLWLLARAFRPIRSAMNARRPDAPAPPVVDPERLG